MVDATKKFSSLSLSIIVNLFDFEYLQLIGLFDKCVDCKLHIYIRHKNL